MKLGLQIGLGILSLIPLFFAVNGIINGASYYMPEGGYPAAIDNQLRYLSAIYLLVTVLLWWSIPKIERQGLVLAFVCAVIFIGGVALFISYISIGP